MFKHEVYNLKLESLTPINLLLYFYVLIKICCSSYNRSILKNIQSEKVLSKLIYVFLKENDERICYFKIKKVKIIRRKQDLWHTYLKHIFLQLYNCLLWEAHLK